MAIRKNKINHQLEQNTAYVWLIVVKIYYMSNKIMNRHDLMKRDPFKEIREWERRFFNDPFFTPSNLLEKEWGEIMQTPSELTEDEKHYHLAVELPGMDKENIKVEAGDKHLRIYGEKK